MIILYIFLFAINTQPDDDDDENDATMYIIIKCNVTAQKTSRGCRELDEKKNCN